MSVRKVLLGAAAVSVSLVLWGCQFGIGPRGGHHNGHHGGHGHAPPSDHYQVEYAPYETVKTVKCPVCGGAGTIQKPYVCHPVPYHQHVSP